MATIEQAIIQQEGVAKIEATTIEQEESGDYVREIRVFGQSLTSAGTLPLLLTLRVKAINSEDLKLLTPPFEF